MAKADVLIPFLKKKSKSYTKTELIHICFKNQED